LTGRTGSREAEFFPNDGYAAYHVRQFLPRCPAGGLTQSAVGGEREFFRGSMLEAETNALGDVGGCFDVVALNIDDSNGDIGSLPGNLANHFNFRELATGHLEVDFID